MNFFKYFQAKRDTSSSPDKVPMADYDVILKGGTFMFEIGPEETRNVVHREAIAERSPVLSTLMSNGAMQESTSGVAHLEDINPQTFSLFAEYAYTGMYRVEKPPPDEFRKKFLITCPACKQTQTVSSLFSTLVRACPSCMHCNIVIKDLDDNRVVWADGKKSLWPPSWFVPSLPNSVPASVVQFRSMEFPALSKNHATPKQYLTTLSPPDLPTEDLVAHAELYVFAERYMIDDLKALCLHKLHRDLCNLEIEASSTEAVLALLVYVYDKTAVSQIKDDVNSEKILVTPDPSTIHGLRTLVMSYAVANAKKLMSYPTFAGLFYDGQHELIADFTKGIAGKIAD